MENAVKKYFSRGQLLTPEAARILNQTGEDIRGKFIVSEEDLGKEYFKIVMNIENKPREVSTYDFVNFYNSKYQKMSKIIQERTKKTFVSINKLDLLSESFVIGMVKDIKEKEEKQIVEIEDPTGNKPVIFNEKVNVELDDVIAVRVISRGSILFGKQILYPDVPLRQPVTGRGRVCFISDLHLDEAPDKIFTDFIKWTRTQEIETIFVVGDIGDVKKFEQAVGKENKKFVVIPGDGEYPALAAKFNAENIVSLSNPAMVELNGLKILLIHKFNNNMLLKRYLGRSGQILKDDYLVLEEVPDIVHCGHTHNPFVENYKSITIVNSGSLLTQFKPVLIDFSTREFKQIDV